MLSRFLLRFAIVKVAPRIAHFNRVTRAVRKVQTKVLMDKIRRCAGTAYGEDHCFDKIQTPDDFRRRVAIGTYEAFAPYIDRVVNGEKNILFPPSDRLQMFALTSGTTAKPKYIPITDRFVREYRFSWETWQAFTYRDHHEIAEHKVLPIVSPARESETSRGVPCGAATGITAEKQSYAAKSLYAVPHAAFHVEDIHAKYYGVVRLAAVQDVGSLFCANPSTLVGIAREMNDRKEQLIRDVHEGTLTWDESADPFKNLRSKAKLRPNPEAARRLEAIVEREGVLYPRHVWPNLNLIACWKGGALQAYLERFPQYFGDVTVRDCGLIASEGRMSLPIQDEGCAGVLDIESHFFEFIPVNGTEEDVLYPWELEVGQDYYIILTTSSGLFRYNIYDVVRVEGFYGDTPVIAFLNKGKHFSSLTGEKLTEYQVTIAVRKVCEELQNPIERFVLCPQWADTPYYVLIVEQADLTRGKLRTVLPERVDLALQEVNIEYATKRKSERLDPIRLVLIRDGVFERQKQERIRLQGGRSEQYKHIYLRADPSYLDSLRSDIVASA